MELIIKVFSHDRFQQRVVEPSRFQHRFEEQNAWSRLWPLRCRGEHREAGCDHPSVTDYGDFPRDDDEGFGDDHATMTRSGMR